MTNSREKKVSSICHFSFGELETVWCQKIWLLFSWYGKKDFHCTILRKIASENAAYKYCNKNIKSVIMVVFGWSLLVLKLYLLSCSSFFWISALMLNTFINDWFCLFFNLHIHMHTLTNLQELTHNVHTIFPLISARPQITATV